jgi:hypothetical protein
MKLTRAPRETVTSVGLGPSAVIVIVVSFDPGAVELPPQYAAAIALPTISIVLSVLRIVPLIPFAVEND